MGDGTRFAIAIAIFFAAGFAFFIAFHPTGSNPAQHPDDVIKWILGEWDTAAGRPDTTSAASAAAPTAGSTTGTPAQASPGTAIGNTASNAAGAIGGLGL